LIDKNYLSCPKSLRFTSKITLSSPRLEASYLPMS
jgi:hypothetical protein